MRRRTILKGAAVATGLAITGISTPAKPKSKKCCWRDHDGDGNCHIHRPRIQKYSLYLNVEPGGAIGPNSELVRKFTQCTRSHVDSLTGTIRFEFFEQKVRIKDGEILSGTKWFGIDEPLTTPAETLADKGYGRRWNIIHLAVLTRLNEYVRPRRLSDTIPEWPNVRAYVDWRKGLINRIRLAVVHYSVIVQHGPTRL